MSKQIKFQKFYVTDGEKKARVHYSHFFQATDGREVVTLYARDYINDLFAIFNGEGYENDTDIQTDYFEKGLVRIYKDNPLFDAALARC